MYTAAGKNPSLLITDGNRLTTTGTEYTVTVKSQNIAKEWKLTLYLYRKETTVNSQNYGKFLYTGYNQELSPDWYNTTASVPVSLGGQQGGSFYLLLTATANEGVNQVIVAQNRYYFIAQETQENPETPETSETQE